MMRRVLLLGVVLAATWTVCALAAVPQPAPADTPRQVLVMLRLPAEHFRPSGDYGADYDNGPTRRAARRLAGRIARTHGLTLVDDWPMPLLGLDCFVMIAHAPQSAEAAAAGLSRDPAVAWSEPMRLYVAQGEAAGPGDPLFRAEPAAREWRLAELHKLATGRGVSVAVIDSQVEAEHPDLRGQVAVSEDFAPQRAHGGERHGTGVAGVIAAKANNGVGIVGVAPGARLLALRACWEQGPAATTACDTLSLAKALHAAIERRAQVINLSLAGPSDLLLAKLVDVALGRGATVVAAYDPQLPHGGFPASHAGVIAVAAEPMARLPPGVYSAPGRDVPTTEPGGRWSLVDGSSYAAAHVSGLVALVREREQASREALALISTPPGGGMIDACATLSRGARSCPAAAGGETLAGLRP